MAPSETASFDLDARDIRDASLILHIAQVELMTLLLWATLQHTTAAVHKETATTMHCIPWILLISAGLTGALSMSTRMSFSFNAISSLVAILQTNSFTNYDFEGLSA